MGAHRHREDADLLGIDLLALAQPLGDREHRTSVVVRGELGAAEIAHALAGAIHHQEVHAAEDCMVHLRIRIHLLVQIDSIHMDEDLILIAAIGVDAKGDKHPLGLIEGATENAATVQALIDNLVERGLDPAVPRLFIIDGAKALSKAIRRTFGRTAAIQRCQVHKARNIMERLPKSLHASVRRVLRQAWELDDADKAEKLIRNLAHRLERDWSGVSSSILEGIEEILTVTRLGLPKELRRSLACTNIIENVMGTVRRVCRNVKRWRSASMAMRWTAAAMQEAAKGFRRLKAHKQLPTLRAALEAHRNKNSPHGVIARQANAA